MDVGVFHDFLLVKGGAERVVLKISGIFDADLITSGFVPDQFKSWDSFRVIDIGNLTSRINLAIGGGYTGFHSIYRAGYLEAALRFYLSRKRWDYEVNVFSGAYSIFAALRERFNVLYCHSPNRTLYDQWDVIYSSKPFYLKPLWNAYAAFLKPRDQEIIRERIDLILANSNNVKERVKKYYGVDSEVVYSPIATSRYMFKKFGDFFLTVNRLIPEKRVDVIVEAFTRMHGKKLVVVGEGPQLPYLKKIAGNSRNVQFLGNVGEDALAEMYGECLATVYMPYHEDYGMVPLEGNAAGKPCISVEEGGCRETVLPGKTGFFIKPDVESLVEQVNALDLDTVRSMRDECISWASQFDESVFKERLVDLIQRRY